jgi:hypothetical protein
VTLVTGQVVHVHRGVVEEPEPGNTVTRFCEVAGTRNNDRRMITVGSVRISSIRELILKDREGMSVIQNVSDEHSLAIDLDLT